MAHRNDDLSTEQIAFAVRGADVAAKEAFALRSDLADESDRAAVIIAAAKLDNELRDLIVSRLVPSPTSEDDLVDGDRALGAFSARIKMAYRLGLIDAEVARSLDIVRRIRNQFAHEAHASSLSSSEHVQRVKELAKPFARSPRYHNVAAWGRVKEPLSARAEFVACVTLLASWLRAATLLTRPLSQHSALKVDLGGDHA